MADLLCKFKKVDVQFSLYSFKQGLRGEPGPAGVTGQPGQRVCTTS